MARSGWDVGICRHVLTLSARRVPDEWAGLSAPCDRGLRSGHYADDHGTVAG
jgi:hypothetical protein